MVFTSHVFVFYFLPLVLASYYLAPARLRNTVLLLASYLFYAWWSPWFVTLMAASTLIDYGCGHLLGEPLRSPRLRRLLLTCSVSANLGLLGFFKYSGWLLRTVEPLWRVVGGGALPLWHVVLPVGISFYTFQSMSYTIDLYRQRTRPAASLLDFAAYVSLFPQLVAGPIVRYRELADQLRHRSHSFDRLALGLSYFAFGFAKKLVLADNLAPIADAAFEVDAASWHLAWIGAIAYGLQIYFDFSGYSDMAIGLGHMFGFRLPRNFASPYRAESITDFWRRWHISLSTWLRDYLYVPLGGNRLGRRRTYLNLSATMLLGGLWHGAQWSFVLWGAWHGLLLAAERALGKSSPWASLPRPLRVLATMFLVTLGWVLFRAPSLADAGRYLASMFSWRLPTASSSVAEAVVYAPFPLLILGLAAILASLPRRTEHWVEGPAGGLQTSFWRVVWVPVLFFLGLLELALSGHQPFLYFQF